MNSRYELEIQVADEVFRYLAGSDPVRERLTAWLSANGLDPGEVCIPQQARVVGETLNVQLYELNDEGYRFVRDEDDNEAAKRWVTVPLVEAPPECWFDRRPAA